MLEVLIHESLLMLGGVFVPHYGDIELFMATMDYDPCLIPVRGVDHPLVKCRGYVVGTKEIVSSDRLDDALLVR